MTPPRDETMEQALERALRALAELTAKLEARGLLPAGFKEAARS